MSVERLATAVERLAAAYERVADAHEAKQRQAAAPKGPPKQAPRKARQDPDKVPDSAGPEVRQYVEPVRDILADIARDNGAEGALTPTLRAVALVLADFPDRDWLEAAKHYRRWQLTAARTPHRDVVRGYRRQLQINAPPVARKTTPDESAEDWEERARRQEAETRRRLREED